MRNQTNQPLISVLLPVFNNEKFLADSLESVLTQSYPNIEVIAIDDFSKDNSFRLLKIFKRADKRLKIFKNVKHYGKAITLNRAIKRAKGQFLVFMDPEDKCYKEKFKKQLIFLQNNPKVVAVGTQCTFINDKDKKTGKTNFPETSEAIYNRPLHGVSMQFQTVMINRFNLPKDLLYFPTNSNPFLYSDIFIKMLAYGQLTNLPHPPLQYHRQYIIEPTFKLSQVPGLIKLWISSIAQEDYRPSIRYISNALYRTLNPVQ